MSNQTQQENPDKYDFIKKWAIEMLRTEFGPKIMVYGKINITEQRLDGPKKYTLVFHQTLREEP